jgi:uncharacterized membrane-anchored protein YitT (DUF2179 family)
MAHGAHDPTKSLSSKIINYLWILFGCFISAFAIEVFFIPNNLIDGGTVGLAMIAARAFGAHLLPLFFLIFNLPFVFLAYKHLGKAFVIQLLVAVVSFVFFLVIMHSIVSQPFHGDNLEVVVIGGAILGIGIGIIIRGGACLDGTEILGIIANKKFGFTVGQVVFASNILVFSTAGLVFQDWHPPLLSLIAYIVVVKIMDTVIVGLDETKSVLVISSHSEDIAKAIMHEMGLGLTIMYGRGGFSGTSTEILYIIVERLQLTDLKNLIHSIDPNAFIAVENLHEIASGKQNTHYLRPKKVQSLASKVLGH